MPTTNTDVPSSLPILPLAEYVLLPSIITTLTLNKQDLQNLLRDKKSDYIICIPLGNRRKTRKTKIVAPNAAVPAMKNDLGQLFHYGCVAKILECEESVYGIHVLKVQGVCRSRIRDIFTFDGQLFEALLEHYQDDDAYIQRDEMIIFQSLCHSFISKMRLIGVSHHVLDQFTQLLDHCEVSSLVNLLLCVTDSSFDEKLRALEITDIKERLHQVSYAVNNYLQNINTSLLSHNNEMTFDDIRRKFYLLQESNSISFKDTLIVNGLSPSISGNQEPLPNTIKKRRFNVSTEDDDETIDLVKKLNKINLPEHAATSVERDLNRLRKLPPSSSDSAVLRIYLEYVADLPWNSRLTPVNDINMITTAKDQLDADHFGIHQVKTRILEYLSVLKVKKDANPPIICFVGPPGVGKTTLGKSIATALQRKFHRLSLGGVRDEAEIRGHRRTYVGALPGLLIHGMRQCGVQNPVFLLDEIDKLVQGSNQGDPAAALLEVLDSAQNATFTDHFINLPYDLSKVMFIATANTLDTIPKALLDRMEVIHFDGYTFDEKLHIAQAHLIPKQIEANGLAGLGGLHISDEVVLHVAEKYTREGGVRGLDRVIASICRYKCKEYIDLDEGGKLEQFDRTVCMDDIEHILGAEIFENEAVGSEDFPGVITGLAYSGSGNGGIMMIEANLMPGTGQLKLTGSLGDIIKESAHLAVSWIRANAFALKLTNSPNQNVLEDIDIHIHMPSGAIPKDGPSAGIAMTACLVSLLSGISVPRTTAMTGEVTLRGQVRPVGGIKEKIISAHRAGIKKIILPAANKREVRNDIPKEVRNEMTFIYCKSVWDVIESAFDHQTNVRWEPRCTSSL